LLAETPDEKASHVINHLKQQGLVSDSPSANTLYRYIKSHRPKQPDKKQRNKWYARFIQKKQRNLTPEIAAVICEYLDKNTCMTVGEIRDRLRDRGLLIGNTPSDFRS